MNNMFDNCQAFDKDISDWNVCNLIECNKMFGHTKYSHSLEKWKKFDGVNFKKLVMAGSKGFRAKHKHLFEL